MIQNGEILTINTPEKIINEFPDELYAVKAKNMGKVLKDIRQFNGIRTCNSFGEYHHITFVQKDKKKSAIQLTNWLAERNHADIEIKRTKASIEDCFIELMK